MTRKGSALSIRISNDLRDRIRAKADATGRSVTQEVERLLELALSYGRIEAELAEVVRLLKAGTVSPNEWRRQMGIPFLQ